MDEIELIGHLQRVELRPGDRLVLTCALRLPQAAFARIVELMERWAPGVPTLFLDEGMTLGVVRAEPGLDGEEGRG